MSVIHLTPTSTFSESLRSIHKALNLTPEQTVLMLDKYGLVLLRKAPNAAIGFLPEPLARYSWIADGWTKSETQI